MRKYWWSVFRRAFRDTFAFVFHSSGRLAMDILVIGIAAYLLGIVGLRDIAREHVPWELAILVGAGMIFAVLLIWNMLAVPAKMDRERGKKISELELSNATLTGFLNTQAINAMTARRVHVVDQLSRKWRMEKLATGSLTSNQYVGLEGPPINYLNGQLEAMREDFRIANDSSFCAIPNSASPPVSLSPKHDP